MVKVSKKREKKTRGQPSILTGDTAAKCRALLAAWRKQIAAGAQIEDQAAIDALSESAATLLVHQRLVIERSARGEVSGEVLRTLPSVASNIRRICESLGSVVPAADDEPDF